MMSDTSTEAVKRIADCVNTLQISGERVDCEYLDRVPGVLRAIAAERDALKAALALMVYEATHLSPIEEDGSHWCRITGPCLTEARAALQEKTDG